MLTGSLPGQWLCEIKLPLDTVKICDILKEKTGDEKMKNEIYEAVEAINSGHCHMVENVDHQGANMGVAVVDNFTGDIGWVFYNEDDVMVLASLTEDVDMEYFL
jgi:hypothetical protein